MNEEKMLETAISLLQDAFIIINDGGKNNKIREAKEWQIDLEKLMFYWNQKTTRQTIASKLTTDEIEFLRVRGITL